MSEEAYLLCITGCLLPARDSAGTTESLTLADAKEKNSAPNLLYV